MASANGREAAKRAWTKRGGKASKKAWDRRKRRSEVAKKGVGDKTRNRNAPGRQPPDASHAVDNRGHRRTDSGRSFVLRNGAVEIVDTPRDSMRMMREILGTGLIVDGGKRRVFDDEDPDAWMRALPYDYDGSRLRAALSE